MLRRLMWVPIVLVLGASSVGVAVASRTAAPPNPTFTLVPFPKAECPQPRVIVGRACVEKFPNPDWTFSDGTAHHAGWTADFEWTVPATVPPAGAAIKMKLDVDAKNPGLTCPGMGAGGGLPLKTAGQEVQFSVCAQQGKHATASKTITVTSPSGGSVYVQIGLGDGPRFTYKYEAQAAKPGCGALRGTSATLAARTPTAARRVEAHKEYTVSWRVSHHGVPERGESPTLVASSTVGAGTLAICADPDAKSALAARVTGSVGHRDVHELPPPSGAQRAESVTLAIKRGSYGEIGDSLLKVALEVEVVRSNDKDCAVGVRGRLTLTSDDKGPNQIGLRLCGKSHTHTFEPGDGIDVRVTIR